MTIYSMNFYVVFDIQKVYRPCTIFMEIFVSSLMKLVIESAPPDPSISHFVQGFWMLENKTGKDIPIVVLPDGMADLFVFKSGNDHYQVMIRGVDTLPGDEMIVASTKMFAISFRLLAVEYLFGDSITDVLNKGRILTQGVWQFEDASLN